MSVAFIAPGKALLYAPRQPVLWRALRQSATVTQPPGTGLAAIAGLSGWWDAGTLDGLHDASGASVTAWVGAVATVADKSGGARPMAPYSFAAASVPAGQPRVSGLLGAVGRNAATAGLLQPALDPDLGFQVPAVSFDSGSAWTRWLVWSRPNLRQGSGKDAQDVTLLMAGGVPVLTLQSVPAAALTLFPAAPTAAVVGAVTRRHTHSVLLRHLPGSGVDVWLDGVKVLTGQDNPIAAGSSDPMTLLHDMTPQGSAQCWLHEAATWEHAVTDADASAILQAGTRWTVGARKGVSLLFNGQSNATNWVVNDGAAQLMAQGVGWYLGALAWNVAASYGQTLDAGHGLYYVNAFYGGTFLNDPQDGSDPSTWQLGTDGTNDQAYIAGLSAEDRADICAIVWPWSETDSIRSYSEKATYKAAVRRFIALERAMVGDAATALPHLWWNAMPFGSGTSDGTQMVRETMAELAASDPDNCFCMLPMTADSDPRNEQDGDHLDAVDNVRLGRLAVPVAARALLAAGHADALTAPPIGLPLTGGPAMIHAYRESATSVLITVQHDAGTDLALNGLAAQGKGFTVMDGGSVAQPGTLVAASACARVDATHLRLTLSTPLANAAANCLLFYPYGTARIGRGNAVTDNWSSLPKPAGWDIAADLGSAWNIDFPLAATAEPLALSDTP